MTQYIDKSALIVEIEKLKEENKPISKSISEYIKGGIYGFDLAIEKTLGILDTLEVKDVNSVWHNIDDIPNFNPNGISDLIIDSYYGHIYREAHYYTPEKWDTHIGFNTNRQFRWAYEKDLIEVQK